jgi:hypothetical protein
MKAQPRESQNQREDNARCSLLVGTEYDLVDLFFERPKVQFIDTLFRIEILSAEVASSQLISFRSIDHGKFDFSRNNESIL